MSGRKGNDAPASDATDKVEDYLLRSKAALKPAALNRPRRRVVLPNLAETVDSDTSGDSKGAARRTVKRSIAPIESVVDRGSFIDTICLCMPKLMPKEDFRSLRLALFDAQGTRKRRLVLKKRGPQDGRWFFFALYIQQPTLAALEVLANTRASFRITEVHVALDLATASLGDAELLQRYVEAKFLKSGRPTECIGWYADQTAYFGRDTRRGVEVAMYSDKPSKALDLRPCLHIDWRLMGAHTIRKAGLHSVDGLVALSHRDFWDQRLQLWQPPSENDLLKARERQLRKYPCTEASPESSRRLVRAVLRAASCSRLHVLANDILFFLNRHKNFYRPPAKRLFTWAPHAWMLPPEPNALWYRIAT